MNDLLTKVLNMLPLDVVTRIGWLDVLLILAPSVILISVLFVLCFFVKIRR